MRFLKLLLPLLASTLSFAAQADRIAGNVESSQMVALAGQTNHQAKAQFDQGRVPATMQMNQLTLLTLPTPSQQEALRALVAEQQDPKSANFRKWITPEQWADRFGLSQNDVQKITAWLKAQGLSVQNVARGRNWITFSGTAAQIESAFHTEIHHYKVNGETHYANATAPSIPAALAGIATGIRGLDDFLPKPASLKSNRPKTRSARPEYYDSNFQTDFVAPGDIEVIYDLTPLYSAGINGAGQKLAIIGQTDVYLADLNDFRSGFGLPAISGCTTGSTGLITSCTTSNTANFQYVVVGTDLNAPSTCGDLTEADLDLEWSAAIAPGAQIIYVNDPVTFTSDCTQIVTGGGVFKAFYYAIDNNVAPVISMSYGAPCEFAENPLPNDEIELTKANSFGITFLNSSGDSGAASCDGGTNSSTNPPNLAVGGLAVAYPASSPEVTAVGGTAIEFPNGFTSTYWTMPTTNPTNGGTAQNAPLPEVGWNDDVELTLEFPSQFPTAADTQETYAIVQSGGGASNCSVQTSDFSNCVSGFPQPSWQTVTISGQTTRMVPDVSLLGSPNFPGYIFCTPLDQWISSSSTASSCAPGNAAGITATLALTDPGSNPPNNPAPTVVGGTSAASPIFAAIVTMLNQYLVANAFQSTPGLGNMNPNLYYIATYNASAFHKINTGTNVVYCEAGQPPAPWPVALQCPGTAGTVGSFGYDASSADASTGYNLVTGLGSVDANTLAVNWGESLTATTTSVVPSTTSASAGTSVTFTATVTPSSATGIVSFYDNGSTTALGTGTVSGGTATLATTALVGGTNSVVGIYKGINASSTSPAAATVTITSPDFTLAAGVASPASIPAGQSTTLTLTIAPVNGSTQTINFTNSTSSSGGSCSGLPAGALCSFNPASVTLNGSTSSMVTLTISSAANMAIPSAASTITVTGTSSGTGGASHAATPNPTLTVAATNQAFTLSTNATTFPVNVGGTAAVNVMVANPTAGGGSPIPFVGTTTVLPITYTCTGTPNLATAEISCSVSPGNGQPTTATAVTVSLVTTPVTAQLRPLGRSRIFYALLLPGLFGIVFAAGSRKRGLRLLSLIMLLAFSTLWLGSCSSGGGGTTIQPNPGTPTGMYAVTINATTGAPTGGTALTSTLAITLNVQ